MKDNRERGLTMDTNEPVVDQNERLKFTGIERLREQTKKELKEDLNEADWRLKLPEDGYKFGAEMAKGFIETLNDEVNESDLLSCLLNQVAQNQAQSPDPETPQPATTPPTVQAIKKRRAKPSDAYPHLVEKAKWSIRDKKRMSVEELQLTSRPANCLSIVCVYTVGDLIQMSQNQLMKQPNFCHASLQEIKTKLGCLGLRLRKTRGL